MTPALGRGRAPSCELYHNDSLISPVRSGYRYFGVTYCVGILGDLVSVVPEHLWSGTTKGV